MPENRSNKRGMNLTQEDRMRGGAQSARQQKRDAHGQFAGKVASPEYGRQDSAQKNRSGSTSGMAGTSRPGQSPHGLDDPATATDSFRGEEDAEARHGEEDIESRARDIDGNLDDDEGDFERGRPLSESRRRPSQ